MTHIKVCSLHYLFLCLVQPVALGVQLVAQVCGGGGGGAGAGVGGPRPVPHLVQLVAQRRDLQQLLLHPGLQRPLLMGQLLAGQQAHAGRCQCVSTGVAGWSSPRFSMCECLQASPVGRHPVSLCVSVYRHHLLVFTSFIYEGCS